MPEEVFTKDEWGKGIQNLEKKYKIERSSEGPAGEVTIHKGPFGPYILKPKEAEEGKYKVEIRRKFGPVFVASIAFFLFVIMLFFTSTPLFSLVMTVYFVWLLLLTYLELEVKKDLLKDIAG